MSRSRIRYLNSEKLETVKNQMSLFKSVWVFFPRSPEIVLFCIRQMWNMEEISKITLEEY